MGGQAVSPEAHGVILPVGQSFVAAANQSVPTNPIPETRRATLSFGSGADGINTTYLDINTRASFTLPVTPTRYRFRIRNSDALTNTPVSESIQITGIYIGVPNVAAEPIWLGDFTTAPLQVYAGSTQDLTTELVTGWVTNTGEIIANTLAGLSYGLLAGADDKVCSTNCFGWTWHSATNVGCATAAANAAVPGVGTQTPQQTTLDVRIEYEYIGRNQIGFFVGDSLTEGFLSSFLAIGKMGKDSAWCNNGANRLGHCAINGGISGAQLTTFLSTVNIPWTRFDLGPGVNSGVSSTPDYAVIAMGYNDITATPYLPVLQTNMLTVIANLKAAGIKRIYVATTPPMMNPGTAVTAIAGMLKATLTAGTLGTVDIVGPVVSTTTQGGVPGQGNPGIPGAWFTSGNVVTVAANVLTGGLTITNVGGFAGVKVGMMVADTTTPGNITVGTQVAAISGTTLTLSQASGTAAADTLTFSPYGVVFELPTNGTQEGPFPISAATGTTTLALTVGGTTVNAHALGCPVFMLPEATRQNFNDWLRSGVPGAMGTLDFAAIAEMPGKPAPVAVGDPSLPFTQQHWEYYPYVGSPHPHSPALYSRWARELVAGLAGL